MSKEKITDILTNLMQAKVADTPEDAQRYKQEADKLASEVLTQKSREYISEPTDTNT